MINGFTEYTHELTPYELGTLLPTIVSKLSLNKGKERAATNKRICEYLKSRGFKSSEPRVRKIINHIRNTGIIPGLVATSNGYYVTDDPQELLKYIDSLKQRANEINRVKESMQVYLKELMNGRAA